MSRIRTAFAMAILFIATAQSLLAQTHMTLQSLLRDYDRALQTSRENLRHRTVAVDSMRRSVDSAASDTAYIDALINLGDAYGRLSADSAIKYLSIAETEATSHGLRSRLPGIAARRSGVFAMQGQEELSVRTFESIDPDSVPESERVLYHYNGQRIYVTLLDMARNDADRELYRSKCRIHNRALLELLPDNSAFYDLAMATRNKLDGKLSLQLAHLTNVVGRDEEDPILRSIAVFWLGTYYMRKDGPESSEAGYYFLLAAIYELKAGVRTGLSLYAVSRWFHDTGDYDRSAQALRLAVENSREGNMVNPWVNASQIAGMLIDDSDRNKRRLHWELGGVVVLLLMAVAGALLLLRRKQQLKREREALVERMEQLRRGREVYVNQFLNLCGIYMQRFEDYDRLVRRKITAGQTDELYKLLKSGKLLSDQGEMFYAVFDNAFLHLYPTFVGDINALLQPDKRIEPEGDNSLTPELRIMAFSILGFEETQRVARFLGLSVNTVYAYRNKLRSRAADRTEFDAAIAVMKK